MKKKGDTLEIFVEHLLKDLGKKRVKRNISKKKGNYRAQIDVQYGLFPSFVECKNQADLVSYADFMKFVGVCKTFQPLERIMVTTSDFERRCYLDAKKYGVELVNHHKLRQLYHKSRFTVPKHHINAPMAKIVRERGTKQYEPSIKRQAINYSKWGLFLALGTTTYQYREQILPFAEQTRPYLEQALEYIQNLL
ncbi:MAG: restriction endonuclease [archaeon]